MYNKRNKIERFPGEVSRSLLGFVASSLANGHLAVG